MLKAIVGVASAALVGPCLYVSYVKGNERLVQGEMRKLMALHQRENGTAEAKRQ